MKTAVVYLGNKNQKLLREMSEGLAAGMENQGARVDIINAHEFSGRLAVYRFIAIGTEINGGFGGKIPDEVRPFLKRSGALVGTRTFAFVLPKGLRASKSLIRLMNAMEGEGLSVVYSDLIGDKKTAIEVGKNLDLRLY